MFKIIVSFFFSCSFFSGCLEHLKSSAQLQKPTVSQRRCSLNGLVITSSPESSRQSSRLLSACRASLLFHFSSAYAPRGTCVTMGLAFNEVPRLHRKNVFINALFFILSFIALLSYIRRRDREKGTGFFFFKTYL